MSGPFTRFEETSHGRSNEENKFLFGGDTADLIAAIRDLTRMLDTGRTAQVPPHMQTTATVPPPMPGSVAAMYQAGANQYMSPIGPQQYQFNMPSPLGKNDYMGRLAESEPQGLSGMIGKFGMDTLGWLPGALGGAGSYAASKTPYGTTGTPAEAGLGLQMGMLKQLSQVAENMPVLGAYGKKQFEGLEEAVYGPEQRARGRLGPTFERMAMAGVNVSDKELEEAFRFAIPMERRGVYMKQRMDRIGASVNAENALSSALSQIGF